MHDLVQDISNWERFYLSGRLQKPVIFFFGMLKYIKIYELSGWT